MADTPASPPSRACKCLNVRIWPQPTTESPPTFLMAAAGERDYALTYVGQQGISIIHPQVTMRTRKIGPPVADDSRCIRFTTLTCLLCQTAAYRVLQLVAPDGDLQEGPLLPSADWVEQETLLSSCGWIQVHKDCLLAEDITRLSSSSTYSSVFSVALPQDAVPTATLAQTPTHDDSKESQTQPSTPVGPFLYGLKPLFPPAPFVPSHSVFTHLSSIAVKASEHFRSLAEEQVATIVRDKLSELEKVNNDLRHNVERLWQKFVESMSEAERQAVPRVTETRGRDSSRGFSSPTRGVSGTPLVSIRNFLPNPNAAASRTLSPSSSLPRVSSLSVSLATSGLHRMVQERTEPRERSSSHSPRSPPPYSSHPSSLGSAESQISSSPGSSPVLSPRLNSDSIVQPFRRSMDETRDTAVSFRYFTILEADVARARQHQTVSQVDTRDEDGQNTSELAQDNEDANATKASTSAKQAKEADAHPLENSDRDVKSPTARRRKVKFDIKAEAITGEDAAPGINGDPREPEQLIFDLDDGVSDIDSPDMAPTLPFIENAQVRRRGRPRVAWHGALPESLSSLRPTSLPAYSVLQPRNAEEPATSLLQSGTSYERLQQHQPEYPGEVDPQEEEILKLVAANTPSHRNAWKRNSKAWQLFVSRRRSGVPGALIPEEVEDGSGRVADDLDDSDWGSSRDVRWTVAASLPIDISPLSRQREPLSLASYQPKTSLSDRTGTLVPVFPDGRHGSSSLRKASYAKRDRSRAIDPGALDFIAGEGEGTEGGESDEEPSQTNVVDESRGRQRALKILEARSKIPEAGMWMSLA